MINRPYITEQQQIAEMSCGVVNLGLGTQDLFGNGGQNLDAFRPTATPFVVQMALGFVLVAPIAATLYVLARHNFSAPSGKGTQLAPHQGNSMAMPAVASRSVETSGSTLPACKCATRLHRHHQDAGRWPTHDSSLQRRQGGATGFALAEMSPSSQSSGRATTGTSFLRGTWLP